MLITSTVDLNRERDMTDQETPCDLPVEIPEHLLRRVRVIQERLERLGVKRPGYQVSTHRRIHVGPKSDSADPHTIHLAPRP